MVPAPNGLTKAPKPKPSEPALMTGVIHIGHDISKIERADSRGDRISRRADSAPTQPEEELARAVSSTVRAAGWTFTTRVLSWRRIRTPFLLERLNFLSIQASNLMSHVRDEPAAGGVSNLFHLPSGLRPAA